MQSNLTTPHLGERLEPMDKVLIIQAARFGDLMQTRRLILSLERRFQTHILVDKSLAELARLIYPHARIHAFSFHGSPDFTDLRENMQICGELRNENFQRIFNCNFSPLTAAVCRLFPDEIVSGYRPARDSDGGIERSPWIRLNFRMSAMRAAASINLVDLWGWFVEDPEKPGLVNPPAMPRGGGIGIALSGREARRSIPPETMASILRVVMGARGGSSIKLFGSKSEKPLARKLLKFLPPKLAAQCVDLSGRTSLPQLMEEVSSLDLLLTPDTGIMHLAAVRGVPVMAFFLSSALCHETGPYGKGHFIWQTATECGPCLEHLSCGEKWRCLNYFSSENFGRCLVSALNGSQPENPPGLQYWSTGFDELGARLCLVAGEDQFAKKRSAERYLAASFLGQSDFLNKSGNYKAKDLEILAEELFPASEWMLPPWRYC